MNKVLLIIKREGNKVKLNNVLHFLTHLWILSVYKLMVIVGDWINRHHVDLEDKDLQIVIHVDHKEYEGDDHGVLRVSYNPRQG